MFGISFPISFVIAFIWNVVELHTDKNRLINYIQRPNPINDSSIGVFIEILELGVYIAIIANSGSISMMSMRLKDQEVILSDLSMFLLMLFLNFLIKYVLQSVVSDLPDSINDLKKRRIYLVKSTIDNYKRISEKKKGEIDLKIKGQVDDRIK